MEINPVIQVRGRPGYFVVLTPDAAEKITRGRMRLFWTDTQEVVVETANRSRRPLFLWDSGYRLVFCALDEKGNLVVGQV